MSVIRTLKGRALSDSDQPGPLAGLLVADFSRVLAGPYCTMLLADLGADVVKVESPGGDDTRSWMPPVTGDGVSTYFLAINRNKRSVALDLKDDGDRALAQELARRADVCVQNFKPGGLARFGLDYDAVSAVNPAIIYASISGFGSGGGKDLPGYDLMVQAMSGLMSLTGDPEGPPYRAGISAFDVMAGVVRFGMGTPPPSLSPYEPLPTGDGDLIVTAGNDAQFRKLCDVLGVPELPDDPRFASNPGRTANREILRPLLAKKLAAKSAAEWFDALIAVGVPCGPINTVDKGIAFAEKIGLEPIVTAGTGERSRPSLRHPVTFSRTPASYPLAPPELDEPGDEIRGWLEARWQKPPSYRASDQPISPLGDAPPYPPRTRAAARCEGMNP